MPYYHIHVRTSQGQEYLEFDQTLESVIILFKLYNAGQRFPVSGMLINRDEVSKIRIFKTDKRNNEILGARVWDVGTEVTREIIARSYESAESGKVTLPSVNHDKLSVAMESFAAFYHRVIGAAKVEKLYSSLFTEEELKKLGKAEKIRQILEKHNTNRSDLKITLGRIIGLHEEYSKKNIEELREIARGFDLELKDDLTLVELSGKHMFEYGVALSFAGEDREHAEALAKALKARQVTVFYDDFEKSKLWGEDLYTYLTELYSKRARYCIMFLSRHYAEKQWTNHERKAAQSRAFKENRAYILPIRLDETEIPGILGTVGYVNWFHEGVDKIAEYVIQKLKQT